LVASMRRFVHTKRKICDASTLLPRKTHVHGTGSFHILHFSIVQHKCWAEQVIGDGAPHKMPDAAPPAAAVLVDETERRSCNRRWRP